MATQPVCAPHSAEIERHWSMIGYGDRSLAVGRDDAANGRNAGNWGRSLADHQLAVSARSGRSSIFVECPLPTDWSSSVLIRKQPTSTSEFDHRIAAWPSRRTNRRSCCHVLRPKLPIVVCVATKCCDLTRLLYTRGSATTRRNLSYENALSTNRHRRGAR